MPEKAGILVPRIPLFSDYGWAKESNQKDDHSVATQVDYSVDYRVDYGGGEEPGLQGPNARLEGSFDHVFYNEDHFDYLQYQDLF